VLWTEVTEPYGGTMGRVAQDGELLVPDPWGIGDEDGETRVGYTGHVRDGGSGLTYMQQRHYQAELGRFLSNDPVGFDVGTPNMFNRYAYAANSPFAFVDPDGRAAQAAGVVPVVGYAIYGYAALGLGVAASFDYGVNKTLGLFGFGVFAEQSDTPDSSGDNGSSDVPDGTTTVEDLIGQATPGWNTKGRTRQHDLPGGFDEANNDFDGLNPNDIETIDTPYGEGRTGTLPAVGTVIVRPGSSGESGGPTLEVQRGKKTEKFRYSESE